MADYSVLGIAHTGITVSDLARSIRFYRTVLGLETTAPFRVSGATVERITGVEGAVLDVAFVRSGNQFIELLSFVTPRTAVRSRMQLHDAGFFHLCLKVTDIEQVLVAMRSAGFQAIDAVQIIEQGPARGMKVVYARDPDGVCLELAEDAPGVIFERLFFKSHPTDA